MTFLLSLSLSSLFSYIHFLTLGSSICFFLLISLYIPSQFYFFSLFFTYTYPAFHSFPPHSLTHYLLFLLTFMFSVLVPLFFLPLIISLTFICFYFSLLIPIFLLLFFVFFQPLSPSTSLSLIFISFYDLSQLHSSIKCWMSPPTSLHLTEILNQCWNSKDNMHIVVGDKEKIEDTCNPVISTTIHTLTSTMKRCLPFLKCSLPKFLMTQLYVSWDGKLRNDQCQLAGAFCLEIERRRSDAIFILGF